MDEPRTCGQGLAERSALPARLSELTAAMADVFEQHQQALDVTDGNGRAEHAAYQQLARDYRNLTSQLRAIADRMAGYRDLPMARHDAEAMRAPAMVRAMANLVERERGVAAILETWIGEDQASHA